MKKYNDLLKEIRVAFPRATLITISVNTCQEDLDVFKRDLNKESGIPVITVDREPDESGYLQYQSQDGKIIIKTNG